MSPDNILKRSCVGANARFCIAFISIGFVAARTRTFRLCMQEALLMLSCPVQCYYPLCWIQSSFTSAFPVPMRIFSVGKPAVSRSLEVIIPYCRRIPAIGNNQVASCNYIGIGQLMLSVYLLFHLSCRC